MRSDEGYVVVSFGRRMFFEQAESLCLSIRRCDPKRPVVLIHNNDAPKSVASLFDDAVSFRDGLMGGHMNKVRWYDYAPFDRMIYIDSDSLMVKNDMDYWWNLLRDDVIAVTGEKMTMGRWGEWKDIRVVLKKYETPYVVAMNGGVIYARRSAKAREAFDRVFEYYRTIPDEISWICSSVSGHNDEPILAVVMGQMGMSPVSEKNDEDGVLRCLMRSTIGSADWRIDIGRHECFFKKHGNPVSPSIAHFCGMGRYSKLVETYKRECRRLHE